MQDLPGTVSVSPQAKPISRTPPRDAPRLLVPWASPRKEFTENLVDLLLARRTVKVWITARPAEFWPDVFVDQRLPWGRLFGSGLYHALLATLVYVICVNWVAGGEFLEKKPLEHTTLTYYSVSDFLPAIDTGESAEPKERKGEPALAKQRIRSLPRVHDNTRQTIITPDPTRIASDVPLPNLVVNTEIPAPPEAAVLNGAAKLTLPQVTPVAPPPDVSAARTRMSELPAPEVVGPAADPSRVRAKLAMPNVPGPEVVGPPPSIETAQEHRRLNVPGVAAVGPPVGGDVERRIGAMNVARAEIAVAPPKLPVTEQQAAMTIRSAAGSGGHGNTGETKPVAAPSLASVAGARGGTRNAGQLIALGIHPVAVNGPIAVPRGSRSGEFAAGPEGKTDAPGTPDIRGGSSGGTEGAAKTAGPAGISVSPGPVEPPEGAVVAANPSPAPAPSRSLPRMLPALGSMRAADIARRTARVPNSLDAPATKSDEVFGAKKFYSMTLNMPAVTSAGGSYIIRFAELHEQKSGGRLTAPIATLKVDPAYPPEAIRDRVEGTVTLYAVIHKDGTVGQVRVLHGIDARLDHNAEVALQRWQFRPATRDGSAVDLEAVVQIPFVAQRKKF